MKAVRLSKSEKAAAAFCAAAVRSGSADFGVQWSRAGHASAIGRGDVLARAGGGGYCKESTVLAGALSFLGETPEARLGILMTGGCGVRSVMTMLAAIGWTVETTGRGRDFQGYRVTRSAV